MTPATREEGLATINEVGKYLSVSRPTLYRLMATKVLPFVMLGRSRRIRWSDVDRVIDANVVQ